MINISNSNVVDSNNIIINISAYADSSSIINTF